MITIRPAAGRGQFRNQWLEARYSFSFNNYFDPNHVQFRSLRVLNEDRVAPGKGFGMHPHDNMEILTWVLDGQLEHKDTSGGGGVIGRGELQYMSAGTGVFHSEFNPSAVDPVHLFQVWIYPEKSNLPPVYTQQKFEPAGRRNRWQRLASYTGAEGAIRINQDAEMLAADLDAGAKLSLELAEGRAAWLQVAKGEITVNGQSLRAGDGAAVTGETSLAFEALAESEVIAFDLK